MREFIGVKSFFDLLIEMKLREIPPSDVFKREALMFSRICCPLIEGINQMSGFLKLQPLDDLVSHIDLLSQHGLFLAPPPSATEPQVNLLESDSEFQALKSIEPAVVQLLHGTMRAGGMGELLDGKSVEPDEIPQYLSKVGPEVAASFTLALRYHARSVGVQLRTLYGMDAYPVFSDLTPQIPLQQSEKCDTVNITLNALPVPDESVPWEQIFEYRSDPGSQSKFLALRHWMSEVARAELPPAEVEEKLEYLIDQYQQHMRLHRMKTNVGTLETVVTTTAEVLGNLASFKWGKAAEALFSLRRRRVALLEGELTAPGSEVAYIVKARETFS